MHTSVSNALKKGKLLYNYNTSVHNYNDIITVNKTKNYFLVLSKTHMTTS